MMTLYDFLRAGHVKRWHILNTATTQTIAEHSYLVTVIALHLFDRMVGVKDDPTGALGVVVGAMFHDAAEIRTGDPPTPSKRLFRDVGGEDLFERVEGALLPAGVPYLRRHLASAEYHFVKMADTIEAAAWIGDNGIGRHAKIASAGAWRRLEDLVSLYSNMKMTGVDWYEPVNEVLMALGLPYISREERISPP
jgi:hypothetical protein